jgi:hypothetical protein
MFGETVYENADSAPSHHFVFNLANVADVCTHYLFTLFISIPLIMLAIYEMLIYRPLWASKSWILDDLSLLVLVALLTALVAGIIQVAYRITHSQQLYNRWLPWSEELAIITGGTVFTCLMKINLNMHGTQVLAVLDWV